MKIYRNDLHSKLEIPLRYKVPVKLVRKIASSNYNTLIMNPSIHGHRYIKVTKTLNAQAKFVLMKKAKGHRY